MKTTLLKFLPLVILVVAAGVFAGLVSTRQAPERRTVPDLGPLVETLEAPAQSLQIIVEAQGSVSPADEIDLVPQVPGVVVWKAPDFEPGGFFTRGDVLLRIDPRDYDLAVTRAAAAVVRARYQLELTREEAVVARQEWDMVKQHRDLESEPTDLVLRLPQVRAAEADLLAAQAGLDDARLRLERTEILAPFDGRVRQTTLDVGQYVVANQPVSRIYSIERAEITVAVPHQDMAWLVIPQSLPEPPMASLATAEPATGVLSSNRSEGPQATRALAAAPRARVQAEFAGRQHAWDGFVTRAAAELDARSRMLRLVVEVDAPYSAGPESDTPLLVGMFVDVQIHGESVDGVRVIPRVALHEDDIVWIADGGGNLRLRQAEVVHVRDEEVLVRLDLADDERVVVSQLSGVTEGMRIRVLAREARS